jgi:transcriptional regulator with XRE-family HTH domain
VGIRQLAISLTVIIIFSCVMYLSVQFIVFFFKKFKGGKKLKFEIGNRKKNKKQAACVYDYALVFELKNESQRKVMFCSDEVLDRNAAIQKYFVTEGNRVYTIDRSESIDLTQVKAIKLEKQESIDLLNFPESESSIFDMPEIIEETEKKEIQLSNRVENYTFNADETRAMRIESEMTQKVFGEKTGIDPRRVSKIERGVVEPTTEEIDAINQLFSGLYMQQEAVTQTVVEPIKKDSQEKSFDDPVLQIEPNESSEQSKSRFFVFQKKTKNNDKEDKIPVGKKTISKVYRWAVWVGIFILSGSGIGAFLVSSNAALSVSSLKSGVDAIADTVNKPVEEQKDESGKIQTYFSQFLPVYMNITTDNEEINKRDETLTQYFATKLDTTDGTITRQLTDYRYFDLIEKDGFNVISYVVTYTIEEQSNVQETEKNTEEKLNEFTQLINIPFAEVEGRYGIIDYPYFSIAPDLNIPLEMKTSDSQKKELTTDETVEATKFVEQFYKNYADNSVEDMKYMMNNPESLNGDYEYVSAENKFYSAKVEGIEVESTVEFKLTGTNLSHKENIKLKLIKKDGKYFVENLNHTLGEK